MGSRGLWAGALLGLCSPCQRDGSVLGSTAGTVSLCFPQSVCNTLWCTVGNTCHSKLDAAVDGTACGESKVTGGTLLHGLRDPWSCTHRSCAGSSAGMGSSYCPCSAQAPTAPSWDCPQGSLKVLGKVTHLGLLESLGKVKPTVNDHGGRAQGSPSAAMMDAHPWDLPHC